MRVPAELSLSLRPGFNGIKEVRFDFTVTEFSDELCVRARRDAKLCSGVGCTHQHVDGNDEDPSSKKIAERASAVGQYMCRTGS
jgi:hypothetical protein